MMDRTEPGPEKWENDELRSTMVRKLAEAIRVTRIHTEQNAENVEKQLFDKSKSKEEYLGYVAKVILYVKQQSSGPGQDIGGDMVASGLGQQNRMEPSHINTTSGSGMVQLQTDMAMQSFIDLYLPRPRFLDQVKMDVGEAIDIPVNPMKRPNLDQDLNNNRTAPSPNRNYCEICRKELCNKYYLETHMMRVHGKKINLDLPGSSAAILLPQGLSSVHNSAQAQQRMQQSCPRQAVSSSPMDSKEISPLPSLSSKDNDTIRGSMSHHVDREYMEKVLQLEKYIEPLRRMIQRVEKEGLKDKLRKLRALLYILTNRDKLRLTSVASLNQCEVVLKRMLDKDEQVGVELNGGKSEQDNRESPCDSVPVASPQRSFLPLPICPVQSPHQSFPATQVNVLPQVENQDMFSLENSQDKLNIDKDECEYPVEVDDQSNELSETLKQNLKIKKLEQQVRTGVFEMDSLKYEMGFLKKELVSAKDGEELALKKYQDLMSKLRVEVECPVCLEVPLTFPVYTCPNGHCICAQCKSGSCPTCRSEMLVGKSLLAKTIIENIEHKCRHEGCEELYTLEALKIHVQRCQHRPMHCPAPRNLCGKELPLCRLYDHIVNDCKVSYNRKWDSQGYANDEFPLKMKVTNKDWGYGVSFCGSKFYLGGEKTPDFTVYTVELFDTEEDAQDYEVSITAHKVDDDEMKGKHVQRFTGEPLAIDTKPHMKKRNGLIVGSVQMSNIADSDGFLQLTVDIKFQ